MTAQKQASFGEILIACIVIMFIVSSCINSFKDEESVSAKQSQFVQTQQQTFNNEEEIKKIEGYIKEFQKAGIFKKVTNLGSDDYGKILEIQVDEYMWNSLDYDTKKAAENMFLQYWKIGHVTVIFRGYRTGQKSYTISKNFKI